MIAVGNDIDGVSADRQKANLPSAAGSISLVKVPRLCSAHQCDAGTPRQLTVGDGAEFNPDRGVREVNLLAYMPRADLIRVQKRVQLVRKPTGTKDSTCDEKCHEVFG